MSRKNGRLRAAGEPGPPSLVEALEATVRPVPGNARTPCKAVILAGGRGTRLLPYTSVLPKPLLPLGDRAILEFVIQQLAGHGFRDVVLSVNHLAHLIEAVLGAGGQHNVEITYVREEVPLGTAGSLRLIEGLDRTFLVLNGDLITGLDYRDLVAAHEAAGNDLTIAITSRDTQLDFGVVTTTNSGAPQVVAYLEKPVLTRTVSMGIYVLEPSLLELIPDGHFDFPDLVQAALAAGLRIGAYEYQGLWLDIGRQDDYQRAVAMWEAGELADPGQPAGAPGELPVLDSRETRAS